MPRSRGRYRAYGLLAHLGERLHLEQVVCCHITCMALLKAKGDLAEVRVMGDLMRLGCKVAIPYGEDWDYDLILSRNGVLERVQVKYTESNGCVVTVRCRSHSLTNGRVRQTKKYTAAMIEWLAVYDKTTDSCYYVPAAELGEGRAELSLRLVAPKNGQTDGIRWARDYLGL